MAGRIKEMADDLQKELHEMWRELKAGQDNIIERLHNFENKMLDKINKNHTRIERLETYAGQGKWAIGLFSIPVVGSLIKLFFDVIHPAK